MPKWLLLRRRKVPFSVGIVAMRESIAEAARLRRALPADVYLWANAYKREKDYYSESEADELRMVDPYWDLNAPEYASLGPALHGGTAGAEPGRRGRPAALPLRRAG